MASSLDVDVYFFSLSAMHTQKCIKKSATNANGTHGKKKKNMNETKRRNATHWESAKKTVSLHSICCCVLLAAVVTVFVLLHSMPSLSVDYVNLAQSQSTDTQPTRTHANHILPSHFFFPSFVLWRSDLQFFYARSNLEIDCSIVKMTRFSLLQNPLRILFFHSKII